MIMITSTLIHRQCGEEGGGGCEEGWSEGESGLGGGKVEVFLVPKKRRVKGE
jgi:hypothetical protein